ncbi:hypothetical protein FRB96_001049 [Tulasnella sp. 330]|nr:hypothetical protein FRB96_001049 [Tulasnella sp. 330]
MHALSAIFGAGLALSQGAHATPSQAKTAITQLFQWNWDSVAAECAAFIGPAGYGFVQVSPPQEHITGAEWSNNYSPVSYTIISKFGNRTQFANMVSTCHAAGVSVIADAVWNHMSSAGGTGIGGTIYTKYVYTGTYETQDFHHSQCGTSDGQPHNYANRTEVQDCELDGLADLATETEWVRGRLATYANDLISLGVDGFRNDAAMWIPASDLANISTRLTKQVYRTQEVSWGNGNAIQPQEYIGTGDVQEFRYTWALQTAFNTGTVSSLNPLPQSGWLASSNANVFVANHDTERGGDSLNYTSPNNEYTLAMMFSLSYPYGTPTILSSYEYDTINDGAPNANYGYCSGNSGAGGWLCQHRWTPISGMIGFYNKVTGLALNNWVPGTGGQVAFGRGSIGFIVINSSGSPWSKIFTTSLGVGTYCNLFDGNLTSGICTGSSAYVASGGALAVTVPAYSALAIYTGAIGNPSNVLLTFEETAVTVPGENIYIVGSISQLGAWSPQSGIAMSASAYPLWTASVSLPPDTTFTYKYVRKEVNGTIVWESDPNRSWTTGSSGLVSTADTWR